MIRIPISELEPGLVLAAPVRHPVRTHHVLLHTGYCVEPDTQARLRRFEIRTLWICHPGFDFLDDRLRTEIPEARRKLLETVKRSFTGVANHTVGAFSLVEYRTVVSNLILNIMAHKENAVLAERILEGGSELFAHCSNVAYLSLVIGMRLKDYIGAQRKYTSREEAEDLTNLGVGAMLHDVGKLGLNAELQGRHFCDQPEPAEAYRTHPERGYRAVRGRVEATAAAVVLHHHQRYDGHGFPEPQPLPGKSHALPAEGRNIHVFARVVSVANAVDALMTRAQQQDQPLVAALSRLQEASLEGAFDPLVLEAALRGVPPFPLGACVELSDGQPAVVIDLNEAEPCRPKVALLTEPGAPLTDNLLEIDLSDTDRPSIAAHDGHPVRPYLYDLPREAPATGDHPPPASRRHCPV